MRKITSQMTNEGNFIAVYKSAYLASAQSGVPYSTVKHAVNGRKSISFNWSQRNKSYMASKLRTKGAVGQVDASTGELLTVFSDIETASRLLGVRPSSINRVLKGDRKSLQGYTFITR